MSTLRPNPDPSTAAARLRLAPRVDHIAPFHVMEIAKLAQELEAQGRDIVHMTLGEPDFGAAPPVQAALMQAVQQGQGRYTAALGTDALRAAIAGFYRQRHDCTVDMDRIIVTAGASGALLLTCAARIAPGDEILMPDPCYPCNRHFVAAFEGVARLIPSGPETRFQLTAAMVERHWGPRTRGVLIASPSNPTGTSIAPDELKAILEVVRAHGGYAIVDEIYQALSYDNKPVSALTLANAIDDLVVINSFSKFFNMTGWRLGWMVAPRALMPALEKLAQNFFICPSALAQHAGLACFSAEALAIYDERRAEFHRRRDYIVPALRDCGFNIPVTPDGAFYVYVDCENLLSSDFPDSDRLARHLLESAGVAMVPGLDFGDHQPERWMRLSYATSMARLQEGIARLKVWQAGRK